MKQYGALFLLLCTAHISSNPKLVHRDEIENIRTHDGKNLVHHEEIENIRTHDGRNIEIKYYISQHCDIENNQSNKMSTPWLKPAEKPILNENKSSFSFKSILLPVGVSSLGCLGYGVYYTLSKFNLFTLSKACLRTAGWSMWKQKATGNFDEVDAESDLLVDILNKYQTDKYATAIARFMQDVDQEYEQLKNYVEKAESAQSSIFRFAYGDVTQDLLQAKARIATLDELKHTVLGWLKKRSHYIAASRFKIGCLRHSH